MARLARAQVLLLLSIANPAQEDVYFARGFYPAKTFEYFGARRPILCAPGDGGLLDELLRETRAGVTARTPDAVAAYLAEMVRAWSTGRAVPYNPDAAAVESYTRRNLTGRLAAILDGLTEISTHAKRPELTTDEHR